METGKKEENEKEEVRGGRRMLPGCAEGARPAGRPSVKHRLSKATPITTSFHVVGEELSTAGKKL